MDRRGPQIGDAASLWNFTPSPGWTKDEAQILKLCVMQYGVGAWGQIAATGLLPGKMTQQLSSQTQRLLGQQSLAAFTGLKVDVDRIRRDNEARKHAQRKAGLIVRSGPNPTKEMKTAWQQEAREKYGLSDADLAEVAKQLAELAAARAGPGQGSGAGAAPAAGELPGDADIMAADAAGMTRGQQVELLSRLHCRLAWLLDRLLQKTPGLEVAAGIPQWPPPGPATAAGEPAGGGAEEGGTAEVVGVGLERPEAELATGKGDRGQGQQQQQEKGSGGMDWQQQQGVEQQQQQQQQEEGREMPLGSEQQLQGDPPLAPYQLRWPWPHGAEPPAHPVDSAAGGATGARSNGGGRPFLGVNPRPGPNTGGRGRKRPAGAASTLASSTGRGGGKPPCGIEPRGAGKRAGKPSRKARRSPGSGGGGGDIFAAAGASEALRAALAADISDLVAMGFSAAKAAEALEETGYRGVNAAANWLAMSCT